MTLVTQNHHDGDHDRDPLGGAAASVESFSLDDRYTRESGTVYLTGIQALVRMVRDRARLDRRQNLRTASFISGYEGSKPRQVLVSHSELPRMLDGIAGGIIEAADAGDESGTETGLEPVER